MRFQQTLSARNEPPQKGAVSAVAPLEPGLQTGVLVAGSATDAVRGLGNRCGSNASLSFSRGVFFDGVAHLSRGFAQRFLGH